MPRQTHGEPETAIAALVGCTPEAKLQLLSALGLSLPHWSAWALLEGWGMKDCEVAERLTQFAFGPAERASEIAHLLPRIIEDKTTCRNRLLELLQTPESRRLDFIMGGLKTLGDTQGDSEVVDIILNVVLKNQEQSGNEEIIGALIAGYSSDNRVKELAKQELLKRDGDFNAVAWTYGSDEEIREKIIEIATPLPVHLRQIIATRLGEGVSDETFTISTLQDYDFEHDGAVKAQASINYHTSLKEMGLDTKSAVKTLSQVIVCYGFDLDERRQAAFCGLVVLDRLDVMVHADERVGNNKPCAISLHNPRAYSPNIPLLRHVLQNWDIIKTAFGNEFWCRFFRDSPNLLGFWNESCIFADEYPSPREEALRFLEERPERTAPSNILRFLERTVPESQLFLEYCLKTLGKREDGYHYPAENTIVAAELLGTHWGGNTEVLLQLISEHAEETFDEHLILTLCEGWPESEKLDAIFALCCKHQPKLSNVTYFQIILCKSSSQTVLQAFTRELSYCHRSSQLIIRPFLRRLKNDDELLSMLLTHLQNNPTSSEKATIPKLISASRGIPSELRAWCIEEINKQSNNTKSPDIGFDLVFGNTQPVIHSLLNVLVIPSE